MNLERLRALCDQAWELRGSPYFQDACQAIVDWYERRHLSDLERRQELDAAALRLLRDPRGRAAPVWEAARV